MIDLVTLVGTTFPRIMAPLFPDLTWRIPSEERVVYFTFDDGPNPNLTPSLAEVLDRHGARGTFFLLGSKVERSPDLVRMLADAGHTIGNHTHTHPDAWRSPNAEIIVDLDRSTDVIESALGRRIEWMRPPFGHFNKAMRAWCARRGQKLTMWDIGVGDYLDRVSRDHIERHVSEFLRRGSIIVLHDNPRCANITAKALDDLLERLSPEGWRFEALPENHAAAGSKE